MPRVVIVDDEAFARQGMRRLLGAWPQVKIVGEAETVRAAEELIRSEKPDALFLDINLPGADGFALLKRIEHQPKVIFVTAYAEHALQAFEVDAVDYLLKPVRPERLALAIQRLEADRLKGEPGWGFNLADHICLRTPGQTVIVAIDQIGAFEAEGDFVRVLLADAPPLLMCQTMTHFEKVMPSPPFQRLSRSLLVNLSRVHRVQQVSRDEARLILRQVPGSTQLGRAAISRLKEVLPALAKSIH